MVCYKEIFLDCIKHKVQFIAGDANQSLQLGHLRNALDAVTPEGVPAKVFQHSDDCVVGIVFHYQELSLLKRVRMSKTVYENYDFRLRPGETDAHRPLKLSFSDGGRDRSQKGQMFRDKHNREREHARRAAKASARASFPACSSSAPSASSLAS